MRIRDILMVIIAVGGLVFGWLQEGSLHLQRGFVITMSDSDVLIHNYPRPVVVDFLDNGKPVLLACPRADILAIYPTHYARRNFENIFVHLGVEKQVQLYSTIVGIAVGTIQTASVSSAGASRKVVAVVTDDYRLEVLDANLQTLWTANVAPTDAGIILHHASIAVLPERIYEQDHGMVVVSVHLAGDNGTEHLLVAAFAGNTGELRWRHVSDGYNVGGSDLGAAQQQQQGVDDGSADLEHAAAVASSSGNASSAPVATPLPAIIINNLRMTPDALAERSNDLHWTHFREAVIGALPHSYAHSWDETMEPHALFHAKNRKKSGLHVSGPSGAHTSHPKYKDRRVVLDPNDVGELGEKAGVLGSKRNASKNAANRHPNAMVLHLKDGIEILHLYTGKRVTRVYPLQKGSVYHDVDDDFHIDRVHGIFGSHTATHHRHGVDLVVDCLGVVTANVPQGQDAMYNATICDSEGLLSSLRFVSGFLHGDQPSEHPQLDPLSLIGSRNVASSTTHGVTPLVVQHHLRKGRDLFKIQRHAVFMIDSGLVTCIDPVSKRVVWRAQSEASFPDLRQAQEEEVSMGLHSEDEKESRLRRFPHLAKYSLHQHDVTVHSAKQRYRETDPFVLAVGEHHLVAINARSGDIAESLELEQSPVAPTMVVDLNGDGVNDVLVFSANSIYGFVVQPRSATSTIAMLMILMVGVLLTLVIAREMREHEENEASPDLGPQHRHHPIPRKVKRSTD